MTEREHWPRPMTDDDQRLEAHLAAAGYFDRFQRFRVLVASDVAHEFGIDGGSFWLALGPAMEREGIADAKHNGDSLGAMMNLHDALRRVLEDLGGQDRNIGEVGLTRTRLWVLLWRSAPFLYSARPGDGEPEQEDEPLRILTGIEAWVG